jgi:N-acetylneuraminate synthase
MGRDYYEFLPEKIIQEIQPNIKHLHIADSAGIDGEGLQIGDGDHRNIDIIKNVLDFDCLKVIEVWQGHLDQGAGFKEALQRIYQLYND